MFFLVFQQFQENSTRNSEESLYGCQMILRKLGFILRVLKQKVEDSLLQLYRGEKNKPNADML